MPMTDERRAELRALCDAATRGEWTVRAEPMLYCGAGVYSHGGESLVAESMSQKDAAFIAASRTAVPEILDEVERLEALNARLKALVRKMEWTFDDITEDGEALYMCPVCCHHKPHHLDDCPVAAEIAELCKEE